jgi:hypothetical protein
MATQSEWDRAVEKKLISLPTGEKILVPSLFLSERVKKKCRVGEKVSFPFLTEQRKAPPLGGATPVAGAAPPLGLAPHAGIAPQASPALLSPSSRDLAPPLRSTSSLSKQAPPPHAGVAPPLGVAPSSRHRSSTRRRASTGHWSSTRHRPSTRRRHPSSRCSSLKPAQPLQPVLPPHADAAAPACKCCPICLSAPPPQLKWILAGPWMFK